MRPLLKLNPYLAKYRWHLLLGTVFIVLSNLFAVYAPQVVREASTSSPGGSLSSSFLQSNACFPFPRHFNCGWVGRASTSKTG